MNNADHPIKVLLAGIGGASLGTELLKCLIMAEGYSVIGCDISPLAFGHYIPGFDRTFVISRENYIDSIMEICDSQGVRVIIPGGEEPQYLLNNARDILTKHAILLAANSSKIIETFTNKQATFEKLKLMKIAVPHTIVPNVECDFDQMDYPCIVKPSTGSGGSDSVFVAKSKNEAVRLWEMFCRELRDIVLQEYIPHTEGEFSLGVLSLPGHGVVGSIALKKCFENKLSIHSRGRDWLISSPYSSGLVDDFADVQRCGESIALAINSIGPLNIQGRMRNGIFVPFEINPRFSGGEYIRAMAGFNQVDMLLKYMTLGIVKEKQEIRKGYYLRSLTEVYVPLGESKI